MNVLIFESGRADGSPLSPVIRELKNRGSKTTSISLGDDILGAKERFTTAFEVVYRGSAGGDILLLLGDRYETLAAASAATICGLPIAHIHGGETTLGSFDNLNRNAITQLSQVHFTATIKSHRKVIDMMGGKNVYHTGAPGLDMIVDLPERKPTKTFILTYHPETVGDDASLFALLNILAKDYKDHEVVWTGCNHDPGAERIGGIMYDAGYQEWKFSPREYILACRQAALVIGNSSSGIIECPSIGVPSVNVGVRQDGRERGSSVFDCDSQTGSIKKAINKALGYQGPFDNPYFYPESSKRIAEFIIETDLTSVYQ